MSGLLPTYADISCAELCANKSFSRGERFLVVPDSLARACEFFFWGGPDLLVTNKKDCEDADPVESDAG